MSVTSDEPAAGNDLSPAHVARALARRAVTRPAAVRVVAETGSTNADLLAAVAAGTATAGSVLAADSQHRGRGRLGRQWESPAGGTLSVSLVVAVPAARAGFLPVLTALALRAAIAETGGPATALKWPNDVIVPGGAAGGGDGKVAGILAEAAPGDLAVVGCGVNVAIPAAALPVPAATSLHLHGPRLDRAELLAAFLAQFDDRASRWALAGHRGDAAGLLAEYRRECATIGQPVRVSLPGGAELTGTCTGVDHDGRLELATAGGHRVLSAGDVVHLRPPGTRS